MMTCRAEPAGQHPEEAGRQQVNGWVCRSGPAVSRAPGSGGTAGGGPTGRCGGQQPTQVPPAAIRSHGVRQHVEGAHTIWLFNNTCKTSISTVYEISTTWRP